MSPVLNTEAPASEVPVETANGEATVNTAAPKKAQRKAAKKAAPKAAKSKAKKPAVKKAKVAKVAEKPLAQTITEGGTRQRTFEALKRYPTGLTQKQIKQRCGMAEVSGHLAVVLGEEIEKGRIKREEVESPTGSTFYIYKLTAAGGKALTKDEVDNRKTGERFGSEWTKARVKASK